MLFNQIFGKYLKPRICVVKTTTKYWIGITFDHFLDQDQDFHGLKLSYVYLILKSIISVTR